MKHTILLIMLFCCVNCFGQNYPRFRELRYDEDYSLLKKDTTTSDNWYKQLKYRTIGKRSNAYHSMGGEVRVQYVYFKNEDWGETLEDTDGYTLSRFLFHSDLHLSKKVRVFTEVQSALANGREQGVVPLLDNPLDLHQLLVDWSVRQTPKDNLTIRAGRQELLYGSQRLISVRNLPNMRQSFDGIKAFYHKQNFQTDVFYSTYVTGRKGIFDDKFSDDIKLWGVYATKNKVPVLGNVDLYYLGIDKKQTRFDDGIGRELRNTYGGRIWGNFGNWKYDLEGVYQDGTFAVEDISAWSLSLITTYEFSSSKIKPQIGLKTELISGNKSYDDKKLQTINPLFPQGAYFGLAAKLSPANLMDIHPSFEFKLGSFHVATDYAVIWRYSVDDGIYRSDVSMIYSGKDTSEKFMGSQLTSMISHPASRYVFFLIGFSWFDTQGFLKEVGPGNDIFMAFGMTQVKL